MPPSRFAYALVAVVVAAAALAFARSEQLKLERAPVGAVHVHVRISDRCRTTVTGCRHVAPLEFLLRRAQALSLEIVDGQGRAVRHLAPRRAYPRGDVHATWDGRDDAGAHVGDGHYHLAIGLASGRTITIPDAIVVDDTPPRVTVTSVRVRGRVVHVNLLLSEQGVAYVAARRVAAGGGPGAVLDVVRARHGAAEWRAPRGGRYLIEVTGRDIAGNTIAHPPMKRVTVP